MSSAAIEQSGASQTSLSSAMLNGGGSVITGTGLLVVVLEVAATGFAFLVSALTVRSELTFGTSTNCVPALSCTSRPVERRMDAQSGGCPTEIATFGIPTTCPILTELGVLTRGST